METKIIELEAELERLRLAEFESQESVLLMNDSIQSSKTENIQLKDQLRKLDEQNRKLARSLEDLTIQHDSLKCKQSVDDEKLTVAETELKKVNKINDRTCLEHEERKKQKNIMKSNQLIFLTTALLALVQLSFLNVDFFEMDMST